MIAWAQMGDANASIPTPQPVLPRPMFGAAPATVASTSMAFVAPGALEAGLAECLGLRRPLVGVTDTRHLSKHDLPNNDSLPHITVDPDSFTVAIDGEVVSERPVSVLPMAQRYFMF